MGVSVGDLDGDGLLDAYLSDLGGNEIMLGTPDGFGLAHGTGAARIRSKGTSRDVISSSWSSGIADVNLDGVLDLTVVNGGFPLAAVENKVGGTTVVLDDPPAILRGIGNGRFAKVWPDLGLPWTGAGRGLVIGDLDGDGDSDLVISRLADSLVVLRNDQSGPSLRIAPGVGCAATTTVVRLQAGDSAIATLLVGHNFLGVHAPEVVAGTLQGNVVVRVDWANGTVTQETINLSVERSTYTADC
jgi:hypothetical protein